MAALLVAIAVMSVAMSVAPAGLADAVDPREGRGADLAGTAVRSRLQLYRKKTSAPGAPSVDVLIKGRFLRQKYLDPITNGDFELRRRQSRRPATRPVCSSRRSGFGQLIGGVRSKSKAKSFRELDGKKTYAEWQFTYVPWKPGGQPALPGHSGS